MAQGRIEAEAVAGEPLGVGRITFELPQEMLPEPLGVEGIGLAEKHSRVLYPALDSPAFGKLLEGLLDEDTPLDHRRAGAGSGGGHLAGSPRPPAADHPLFPLPRREPLELSLEGRTSMP